MRLKCSVLAICFISVFCILCCNTYMTIKKEMPREVKNTYPYPDFPLFAQGGISNYNEAAYDEFYYDTCYRMHKMKDKEAVKTIAVEYRELLLDKYRFELVETISDTGGYKTSAYFAHKDVTDYNRFALKDNRLYDLCIEADVSKCVISLTVAGYLEGTDRGERAEYSPEENENTKALEYKSLIYEMQEKDLEFYADDQTLVYKNSLVYPCFEESCEAARELNMFFSSLASSYCDNKRDYNVNYEELCRDEPGKKQNLPFFDDMIATVKYNKNGYLSVDVQYSMYGGGAHIYDDIVGLNIRVSDGKEMTYDMLFAGSTELRLKMEQYYVSNHEELGTDSLFMEGFIDRSEFTLEETGICFYLNMGDAPPPVEILIPYTEENTPVIDVQKALERIEMNEQEGN